MPPRRLFAPLGLSAVKLLRERREMLIRCVALAACFASVSGCYTGAPLRAEILLSVQDGFVWVEAEQIPLYQCIDGLFMCADSGGRLTKRLCQCVGP
jgi:hypothetical protein